jgi:hypothetical protein
MTALAKPAAIVNGRPVFSSERAPHLNKPPQSDSNKNLVLGHRRGLHTKIDWPIDRWSYSTSESGGWQLEVSPALELAANEEAVEASGQSIRLG